MESEDTQPWGERLREWREITMAWNVPMFLDHFTYHAGHLGEYKKDRLVEATPKDLWRWESGKTQSVHAQTRRILGAMGAPLPSLRPRRRPLCLPYESPVSGMPDSPASGQDDDLWRPESVDAAELIQRVTREDLLLNRRELGRLFSSVLVGGSLLDRLERWLALPAQVGATASAMRPTSIGYEEVSELESAARIFREWDDQHGGGLRRKAVIGQLNEVADVLRDTHPFDISNRLHIVMAELSETAATMSWDIGHQALAQRYYFMALHAARTANDLPFAANVMAGIARQLLCLDRPHDALEIVRLAQSECVDRATPAVRSMLYTREAWALAATGRVVGLERATESAERMLAASSSDQEPHWIQYFDVAELHGTTGGRLLEIAHQDITYAASAQDRIGRAINAREPGRLRSNALDEIGLAEASVLLGNFDEAVRIGNAALDVAEQTSSDRVRVQLSSLRTIVEKSPVRETADLRDRMDSALASSKRGV